MRLDLAYRGTPFRGAAANDGVRTVAGDLTTALGRILGEQPRLTVAGRTDAGVHATGQTASFRTRSPRLDTGRLASALTKMLAPDIVVRAATVMPAGFDARFSARSRRYEYRVLNAAWPDPRYADVQWHVAAPLDLAAMNAAAAGFVGEHDFTSFCRRPKDRPDAVLVRRVLSAAWRTAPDGNGGLVLSIEATAFCHQMVRSIVGLCVSVGAGERRAEDVPAVLAAKDRSTAAPVAPPHALTLVEVTYETEPDGNAVTRGRNSP